MLRASTREMNWAVRHVEEYLQGPSIPQHVKQPIDASNSLHASPPALAGRRLGAIPKFVTLSEQKDKEKEKKKKKKKQKEKKNTHNPPSSLLSPLSSLLSPLFSLLSLSPLSFYSLSDENNRGYRIDRYLCFFEVFLIYLPNMLTESQIMKELRSTLSMPKHTENASPPPFGTEARRIQKAPEVWCRKPAKTQKIRVLHIFFFVFKLLCIFTTLGPWRLTNACRNH